MTGLRQDVRYCLRGFRQQPGFVAMAILALGLGIGSATAGVCPTGIAGGLPPLASGWPLVRRFAIADPHD